MRAPTSTEGVAKWVKPLFFDHELHNRLVLWTVRSSFESRAPLAERGPPQAVEPRREASG